MLAEETGLDAQQCQALHGIAGGHQHAHGSGRPALCRNVPAQRKRTQARHCGQGQASAPAARIHTGRSAQS